MNQVHATAPVIVHPPALGFWRQLLADASLQSRSDLEKLITGCEIIAALDDLELLGE